MSLFWLAVYFGLYSGVFLLLARLDDEKGGE